MPNAQKAAEITVPNTANIVMVLRTMVKTGTAEINRENERA
jgi:hypothetical protein